ncbi:LysR substrate-binding domain-containing protein [Paraburkholderia sediminicola]|uniref:LysR substrate-binding domain-containing protein n=1 Tax=Paraburkholderia sediminicola TaxID=458836 RepID=UPI0038BBD697
MSQRREAIDTHLLHVLNTLLIERSVTRTGVMLNQSQPAVSCALRRLRDITGDPLLVYGKSGMVPTEYGLSLLGPTQNALREISRITAEPPTFDSAHSIRCYRIGCPDYLDVLFVPTVVELFRQSAPKATLEFHPLGADFDFEVALEEGKLDIVVGNWLEPPEHLRSSNLFVDEIVCLVSNTHPGAKCRKLTPEQYVDGAHLAPTRFSMKQRGTIDLHLAREHLRRRVIATVPHFNLAPYVLVKSDMIFTTTRLFAEYYASRLPLTVLSAPVDFPPMRYYQLWHERSHYSGELRWLRGLVTDAAGSLIRGA